ncbi:MAG: hypothetical protein AB8B82_01155 [Roseovarius sp.]
MSAALTVMCRALVDQGWREVQCGVFYRKGDCEILFDTSAWMILSAQHDGVSTRIMDVPVPTSDLLAWTLTLIAHLFDTHHQTHVA